MLAKIFKKFQMYNKEINKMNRIKCIVFRFKISNSELIILSVWGCKLKFQKKISS